MSKILDDGLTWSGTYENSGCQRAKLILILLFHGG